MRNALHARHLFLAAASAALGLTSHALGDVWVVDNLAAPGPTTFNSIQDAFNAMSGTLSEHRTLEIRNNGVQYLRGSFAGAPNPGAFSTGSFNLDIVGVPGTQPGRPTINDLHQDGSGQAGFSSLNLDNKTGISVFDLNFVATEGGGNYIDNFGGISTFEAFQAGQHAIVSGNTFSNSSNAVRNGVSLVDNGYNRGSIIERNHLNSGGVLVETQTTSAGGRPTIPMVIRNNIVQGAGLLNVAGGNVQWGSDTDPGDGAVYILNNSLRGAGTAIAITSAHQNYDGDGLVVLNNAFEGTSAASLYYHLMQAKLGGSDPVAQNGTFDHNLFSTLSDAAALLARTVNNSGGAGPSFDDDPSGLADWRAFLATSGLGRDELNSILADPGWAGLGLSAADMDLLATSAAIDMGAPLDTVLFTNGATTFTLGDMIGPVDFFGRERVMGNAIDIGAAEFVPEPGSLTALAFAGAGLLARRRRLKEHP